MHSHKQGRVKEKASGHLKEETCLFPTVLWPEQSPKAVTNLWLGYRCEIKDMNLGDTSTLWSQVSHLVVVKHLLSFTMLLKSAVLICKAGVRFCKGKI